MTTIEWTHAPGFKGEAWNPATGCTKVSAGCVNCYAAELAHRFWSNRRFGEVKFHQERLSQPFSWKKPRMVFVNSMGDLFHDAISDKELDRIFAVMALNPQHRFLVLTKRPERMVEYCSKFLDFHAHLGCAGEWARSMAHSACNHEFWPYAAAEEAEGETDFVYEELLSAMDGGYLSNVWLGVTVENQLAAEERIPQLLQTPAAKRFISCEPLLEPIDLSRWLHLLACPKHPDEVKAGWGHLECDCQDFFSASRRMGIATSFDWVIVGGESGGNARICNLSWIQAIVSQCRTAKIPCFVKQIGSNPFGVIYGDHWILGKRQHAPYQERWSRIEDAKGADMNEWPKDMQVREWPL